MKIGKSFDEFKAAFDGAITTTIQECRGIVHRGPYANSRERRFNSRRLQRYFGCQVKYFIEETPIGACAVIFTMDGHYWDQVYEKREYYPERIAFQNALDFDPRALRILYRKGPIGWHGKPWHVLLAAVAMDVMTEPPCDALPWNGGAK